MGGGQAVNRTDDHPGADNDPSWSPDGRQIAFWSDRDAPDWYPRWSPDGSQIAFYAYRSGNREVWTMPVTGGPARQLTDFKAIGAEAFFPTWSHDG